MMKKCLAMILCLVLVMTAMLPGASAVSAQLFEQDMLGEGAYAYLASMTAVDGTLYALMRSGTGLCLAWWRDGMAEAEVADTMLTDGRFYTADEEVTDENRYAVSYLFTDGGRLMSVNPASGLVFAMEIAGGEVVFTDVTTIADTSAFYREDEEYAYMLNVSDVMADGGKLYWLTRDWTNSGEEQNVLTAYDLTTGAAESIPAEHVIGLTSYRDGKLLAVVHDTANSWDAETSTIINPTLAVLDPATGSLEAAAQFDIYSVQKIAYSQALDALIYCDNGRVMGLHGLTEARQYGYIPVNWAEQMTLLDDHTLVVGGYEGALVRPLQADFATDEYLNVYNSYLDDGTKLFTERYPSVPVYFARDYYDDVEQLNQAMIAGEDALDLLQMNVAYTSFLTLMEKGYCADLSGDAELMAMAERLHPVFREAVMRDGKLYAVPMSAYSFGWAYNAETLEEMELDEDIIPTDFIALCELVTEWNDGLMDDYPEYSLFEGVTNTREFLFNRMVDSYMYWCASQGEDVSFNTPVFRQMMDALENMRCDEMDRLYSQDEQTGEIYRQGLLMYGYTIVGDFMWMIEDFNPWQSIIRMQLTPDTAFFTEVRMEVMFINPRTAHMTSALELLKCRLEGMSEEIKHTLFADETAPVENPYYQQAMNEYQANIEEFTAQLETAGEAEKPFIQDAIDSCRLMMAEQEKYRWNISAEAMEKYHSEIVPAMILATPTLFNSEQGAGTSELTTLMNRFRDGQIDLEQFIREADSKLWMMRMENQ